jgi:hypothetical protein
MHGQIPITPVMGAQLDVIMTHGIMLPLRHKILEKLSSLVLANKPSNWLCIYFSTFTLLHDCSLKVIRNAIYGRKHGMKVSRKSLFLQVPSNFQLRLDSETWRIYRRSSWVRMCFLHISITAAKEIEYLRKVGTRSKQNRWRSSTRNRRNSSKGLQLM